MAKETKGKPIAYQTIVMLVVIIVLAGGFAYSYVSMSNRISTVCQQATSVAISEGRLILNMTFTFQSQIRSDNSLIQNLTSTRPAGFTDMIATLNSQITQDLSLITYYQSLVAAEESGVNSVTGPCS